MTQQEYNAWLAVTNASRAAWVMDELRLFNNGEMLFYRASESKLGAGCGTFVLIGAGGRLEIGYFQGAIPHIGEALFTPTGTAQFQSQEAAFGFIDRRYKGLEAARQEGEERLAYL